MRQPPGVIVSGVLQTIGSFFVLLMAAIIVLAPRLAQHTSPKQPMPPLGTFIGGGVFYLMLAILGMATAAGLFQLQTWARYSTLIFAGLLVFMGLMLAFVFAVMPFKVPPNQNAAALPANFELGFKTVAVVVQLAIAALGGWWLYYFNCRKIRAVFEGRSTFESGSALESRPAFESGSAKATTDDCPVSIMALAALNLLGIPWFLLACWMAFPIMFLGAVWEGTAARVVHVIYLTVALYLGVGLLRLNPASRLVAIWYYVFAVLNMALFYFLPGRDQRWERLNLASMHIWHIPTPDIHTPAAQVGVWVGIITVIVYSAVALYFLVARRTAFEHRTVDLSGPGQPTIMPG